MSEPPGWWNGIVCLGNDMRAKALAECIQTIEWTGMWFHSLDTVLALHCFRVTSVAKVKWDAYARTRPMVVSCRQEFELLVQLSMECHWVYCCNASIFRVYRRRLKTISHTHAHNIEIPCGQPSQELTTKTTTTTNVLQVDSCDNHILTMHPSSSMPISFDGRRFDDPWKSESNIQNINARSTNDY